MTIDKQFTFKVDFIRKNSLCMAEVNQEDTVIFNIFLTKNGEAIDLTEKQLRLFAVKPDNQPIYQDNFEILDIKGGAIRIKANTSLFQAIGTVVCQIDIWGSDKSQISSGQFLIQVGKHIGGNDIVNSYIDVPLFRELSEYVDTAVKLIDKYKELVEAFTDASVSVEGLHEIKQYIDNNLEGLTAQGNRAEGLISDLKSIISEAEVKRTQLSNIINDAVSKNNTLNETITIATNKNNEVKSTTSAAENKKNELQGVINSGTAKVSEINSTISSAESKKQEVNSAISSGTAKVGELNTVITKANDKKNEVVTVTNTAETKRQQLQEVLDNVGEGKYVKKPEMDTELGKKLDKAGGRISGSLNVGDLDNSNIVGGTRLSATADCDDANSIWKSGFYDLSDGKNVPFNEWTWLIHAAHRHNNPTVKYGLQIAARNVSNSLAFRTTNSDGAGTWQHIYHTGNKPTLGDIGAASTSHKHTAAEIGAIPNNGSSTYAVEGLQVNKLYVNQANRCGLFNGYSDGASNTSNNVKLQSWYGIGFAPSIEGQPIPLGEYSHWFNTRNGNMKARGSITADKNISCHQFVVQGSWMQVDGNGKNLGLGTGSEDCFITNSKCKRFLQFQDNGNLSFNGSFISSSDKSVKEDIKYINQESFTEVDRPTPFIDFIKNFQPAQFRYKGATDSTFGFIAQDIVESEVGKLFISNQNLRVRGKADDKLKMNAGAETKESLMYDLGAYTTVVATALQETIKEKDEEIYALRQEISEIKKFIGM